MDAENKTLDFAGRKKDYDEVQEILCRTTADDFYRHADNYYAAIRSDIGNVRATPLSSYRADLERRGALFQEVSGFQAMPKIVPSNMSVPFTAKFSAWRTWGIWITTITAIKPNCANFA